MFSILSLPSSLYISKSESTEIILRIHVCSAASTKVASAKSIGISEYLVDSSIIKGPASTRTVFAI